MGVFDVQSILDFNRNLTSTAFNLTNILLDTSHNISFLNNLISNKAVSQKSSDIFSPLISIETTTATTTYITKPTFDAIEAWGPQRDSLLVVIPITIIYGIIFITGVIGNIVTCIVIKKNRSMHTATNYYLFSLAISDFLLLISGVPQEVYYVWLKYPYMLGEIFCIGRGFIAETSANATVLTITAFTVERYVAICHPFMAQAMSKLNRATRIILLIWFTSFLTAIPQAAQFGIQNFYGYDRCVAIRIIIKHSFQLSTFIFFFAPMSIILILYLLIGCKLHQTNIMRSTNGNFVYQSTSSYRVRQQAHQGTRRVLKMLVAVVIAFFICWAPFHAQRLIAVYGAEEYFHKKNPIIESLYNVMTYISGVLYYLSTCINPLLYNLMSNKFRKAFKETLEGWNIFSTKTGQSKQKYYVFSRSKRLRTAFQESSSYTNSSQREESFKSSSSSRKNNDAVINFNQHLKLSNHSNDTNEIEYDNDRKVVIPKINQFNNKNQLNQIINDNNILCTNDLILQVQEVNLPSKDATLSVVHMAGGDIQIRLLKKKSLKSKRGQGKLFLNIFSKRLKKKSNVRNVGFYTPPNDD